MLPARIVGEQHDDRADCAVWKEIDERQRGFAVVWPLAVGILSDRESGHSGRGVADYKKETDSECCFHARRHPSDCQWICICGDYLRVISGRYLSKHDTDRETYMGSTMGQQGLDGPFSGSSKFLDAQT